VFDRNEPKKRVWILNHYANLPGMGASLRHFNLAKELAKQGYAPRVFASSAMHNSDSNVIPGRQSWIGRVEEGVDFTYVRTSGYSGNGLARGINILQYCLRVPCVARRQRERFGRPDVIIASSMHPFALFVGLWMARAYKCKYIAEIRDLWPESLAAYYPDFNKGLMSVFYRAEKYIYKNADKVIFTMAGGRDYVADKGWLGEVDEGKLHHINNGVDLCAFVVNRDSSRLYDPDLADGEAFKAVYTGSVRRVNNLAMLVEAAAVLKAQGRDDIKILVWGEGGDREALSKEAAQRGLGNIVFKGYVDKKYIPYIVSQADVNILHQAVETKIYKYGTSQNKKFDYLAAGRPILCTVPSNFDIVAEGGAGVSLETQTPEAISEALVRFRDMDPDEYSRYCANAATVAEEYDFAKLADRLIDIIES
jgi:glycosyltransferase involved in cell wall biosynthesis